MRSWVRYSVSAYLGLLLAGSIAWSGPEAYRGPSPVASIRRTQTQDAARWYLVPKYDKPRVQPRRGGSSVES